MQQTTITPRWYQEEAAGAILKDWADGMRNALISLPTATGKSLTFTYLMSRVWQPGKRIMAIAHTKELVQQPKATFEKVFSPIHPKAKLGIVQGTKRNYSSDVVFATIQTLYRAGYKALAEILMNGQIDYFIIDESHHIIADVYVGCKARLESFEPWQEELEAHYERKRWLANDFPQELAEAEGAFESNPKNELAKDALQAIEAKGKKYNRLVKECDWMESFDWQVLEQRINSGLLTLGVTATPYRTDNVSLGNVFPEIMERDHFTYCLTIREAIAHDILAPVEVIHVKTNWDTSHINLEVLGGDERWLDIWEAQNGYELIIDRLLITMNPDVLGHLTSYDYDKHHDEVLAAWRSGQLEIKPTMFFMSSIDTSKELVKKAGELYGIVVGHIDGSQCRLWDNNAQFSEKIKRDDLLEKFQNRKVLWISNYAVLTEGFDAPHVEYGVIARATQSRTLYVQMVGRFLRKDPNNPNKVARILQPDYEGHQLTDVQTLTGEILSEEVEAIEEAYAELEIGHLASIPPCNACGEDLERIRGTREYQCTGCGIIYKPEDIGVDLPEIVDAKSISGKGTFAKYISLFAEAAVAWYKEADIWSVYIGVGGNGNGNGRAERTLLLVPPGRIPSRPDGYSLVEVRRPVLSYEWAGNRWKRWKNYTFDRPVGCFIGEPGELDGVLDVAQERIELLKDPDGMLSNKDKQWRSHPATDKQISELTGRFRIPREKLVDGAGRPRITKGEAKRIRDHHFALNFMRSKGIID